VGQSGVVEGVAVEGVAVEGVAVAWPAASQGAGWSLWAGGGPAARPRPRRAGAVRAVGVEATLLIAAKKLLSGAPPVVVGALIGLPYAVFAAGPGTEPDEVPSLDEVVAAEGWKVTLSQSGIYKPGAVLVPNSRGTHDVVANNCVDAVVQVEALAQSSIASSLRGGVKGAWGLGGVSAGAEVTKRLTFIDPEQRTIPLGQLRLSPECRSEIAGAERLRNLDDAIVVHDVLVAVIKSSVCMTYEARGGVAGIGSGEVAGSSDCVKESDTQVPVGFKAIRLRKVLAAEGADAAVAVSTTQAITRPTVAVATNLPQDAPGASAPAAQSWQGESGYSMRLVPAFTYSIGCTDGQGDACDDDEVPVRRVTLSRAFFVGQTEVTQGLYERVMGANPSLQRTCGPDCPVENLTWREAATFANRLSVADGLERCYSREDGEITWPRGLDCTGYRLPTEAEWEAAARGGRDLRFAGGGSLERLGWFRVNSGERTHPVGQLAANAYGVSDMSGNVWEWVWDFYAADQYRRIDAVDPVGPAQGEQRVFRGGSWHGAAGQARVSNRASESPAHRSDRIGLRLVRTAG
jgi:formylglycine-generating enzyme required for sulfatase activity